MLATQSVSVTRDGNIVLLVLHDYKLQESKVVLTLNLLQSDQLLKALQETIDAN